jgi:hypothetical protein
LVQARTGKLRDDSLEVSLISALMAIHSTSLKVARHNHQEAFDTYHVFSGGDHDLLFIPVTPLYALLVAGKDLVNDAHIVENITSLLALRAEVEKSLKSMGVTGELTSMSGPSIPPFIVEEKPQDVVPAPEMEALFKDVSKTKPKVNNVDDFWNQAAEIHGNKPITADVISLEDARKLGLVPGDGK